MLPAAAPAERSPTVNCLLRQRVLLAACRSSAIAWPHTSEKPTPAQAHTITMRADKAARKSRFPTHAPNHTEQCRNGVLASLCLRAAGRASDFYDA
jgi:hypothetical protein